MINRAHARALLLPGRYQWDADRGIPFTDAEFNAVVDALCVRGDIADAKRLAESFVFQPMLVQAHQRRLAPLRSISLAYRQSQIPIHFRNSKEKDHDARKSTQKTPRRTPQAPDTGWHGRTQSTGRGEANDIIAAYAAAGTHRTQLTAHHLHAGKYGVLLPANAQNFTPTPGGITYYDPSAGRMIYQLLSAPTGTGASVSPPAAEPLPTEIKAGEIIAWRAWRPGGTRRRRRLLSVSAGCAWEPATPMTDIGKRSVRNGDGVHAFKTELQARAAFSPSLYVIGEVELWGEVVEHDLGYRAQYATIRSLVRGPHLNHFRAVYGLPVGPKRHAIKDFIDNPFNVLRMALAILLIGQPTIFALQHGWIQQLPLWPTLGCATWLGCGLISSGYVVGSLLDASASRGEKILARTMGAIFLALGPIALLPIAACRDLRSSGWRLF